MAGVCQCLVTGGGGDELSFYRFSGILPTIYSQPKLLKIFKKSPAAGYFGDFMVSYFNNLHTLKS